MPRNGSGIYSKPTDTTAITNTTIESVKYNSVVDDLVSDANAARPLVAGGTGAATQSNAQINILGTATSGVALVGNGTIWQPVAIATAASLATTDAAVAGKAATVHTHTASQISDSTATGRAVVVAADAAAARSAIGVTLPKIASTTYSTYETLTATIPGDNTIPQISEGTEIMSLAFTPNSASSTILVTWTVVFSAAVGLVHATAPLFKDAGADALYAPIFNAPAANLPITNTMQYTEAAGSTTARTYRIRMGGNANIYMNGTNTQRLYGGVCRCVLTVIELP